VVEEGAGGSLLVSPRHPVTRALLAASGRDLLFTGDHNGSRTSGERIEVTAQGGRP